MFLKIRKDHFRVDVLRVPSVDLRSKRPAFDAELAISHNGWLPLYLEAFDFRAEKWSEPWICSGVRLFTSLENEIPFLGTGKVLRLPLTLSLSDDEVEAFKKDKRANGWTHALCKIYLTIKLKDGLSFDTQVGTVVVFYTAEPKTTSRSRRSL